MLTATAGSKSALHTAVKKSSPFSRVCETARIFMHYFTLRLFLLCDRTKLGWGNMNVIKYVSAYDESLWQEKEYKDLIS